MEHIFFSKNDIRTYANNGNIGKIITGQEDNYTTGCLLDYVYFKSYYDISAIDLSKQQTLDPDPKAMHQNNFSGNLYQTENTKFFSLLKNITSFLTNSFISG